MAARWLSQVGVLAADSPPLSKNARVYDLALALQDGSILCEALNKISPHVVPQVHQKSEKQFLKMQNINGFLNACVSTFSLKPSDLFSADELYYASNFPKVVHTLSLLSKTQMAGINGFLYFPRENESAENKAVEDGEDLYHKLEDLVGECLSLEEAAVAVPIVSKAPEENDEDAEDIYGQLQKAVQDGAEGNMEEVYTDLIYAKREPIYSAGKSSHDEKRNCVLDELKDTEHNYVKLLHCIIDVFVRILGSNPKAISKVEVKTIFSNLEDLLAAHTMFRDAMDRQLASHTGRNVGPCFLDAIKSFRCYGQYCCDVPDAIAVLRELNDRPAAKKLLEQAKAESGQRFPLQDLLNVPMQRVLKYPLLLKELIKYTPDSHGDKENLRAAFMAVENLAKFINDSKKDHDLLRNMIASLRQYSGRPIQTYGVLIKDGDLMYRCDAAKQRQKLRYVFLFNNGVLCCKAKGQFYHFKAAIDLDQLEYSIEDMPSDALSRADQDGRHSFYWMLRARKGATDMTHVFAAKSQAAKKKWIAEMQLQLQTLRDRRCEPPSTLPRGTMHAALPMRADAAPPTRAESSRSSRHSTDSRAGVPLPAVPDKASSPIVKQSYEQWVIGPPPPSSRPTSPPSSASPAPSALPTAHVSESAPANERWFAGRMPRGKADQLLEAASPGTYLIRESDSRPGDYSLSVVYGAVKHIKINRRGIKYEVAPDARAFSTVQELVTYFQQHSLSRHFPGVDTTLLLPFRDALARKDSSSSKLVGVGRARARFAYVAKSHDELSFDRGTELIILSMQELDPGWWRGALPDGRVGVFPANYVQQL